MSQRRSAFNEVNDWAHKGRLSQSQLSSVIYIVWKKSPPPQCTIQHTLGQPQIIMGLQHKNRQVIDNISLDIWFWWCACLTQPIWRNIFSLCWWWFRKQNSLILRAIKSSFVIYFGTMVWQLYFWLFWSKGFHFIIMTSLLKVGRQSLLVD